MSTKNDPLTRAFHRQRNIRSTPSPGWYTPSGLLGENSSPNGNPVTEVMVTVNNVASSPEPGSTTEGEC